jgi:hypothetical protein
MNKTKEPVSSTPVETAVEGGAIVLEAVPYVGGVLSSIAAFFLEKRKNERLNTISVCGAR